MPFKLNNKAFAAEDSGYILLEPSIKAPAGFDTASETPTTLSDYISSVYVILFVAVMLLAVIAAIVYGTEYMFTNVYALKINAREKIMKVVWGIGIALISWLIINQINPDLAGNITNGNILLSGLKDFFTITPAVTN